MSTVKYKGITGTDVAAYHCPYIPIQVVVMKNKIKFRFKDVGEKRWACIADVPRGMVGEFEAWMREVMPNVWLNKAMWDPMKTRATKTYEIRGGNNGEQLMLVLKWGQ